MAALASSTCFTDRCSSPEGEYPSPTPKSGKNKAVFHITDTPITKNKRKRSEPRKRTDFSIKRFCPDSPRCGSVCSDSGQSEDVQEDPPDTPDRSNTSPDQDSSQGLSDSSRTPPVVPQGMFMFPGPFPPNYMVPNLHYNNPAFLPNGHHFSRMDFNGNNNTINDNIHGESEHNDTYEDDFESNGSDKGKKTRKNYKNMTRERRVEANARERTRVHTISAAFESLRRAVPSYSYNQKLSKLAILRIASSYIMALGRLAEPNNSEEKTDRNQTSFGELVDLCTQTIQTEGRARRRH